MFQSFFQQEICSYLILSSSHRIVIINLIFYTSAIIVRIGGKACHGRIIEWLILAIHFVHMLQITINQFCYSLFKYLIFFSKSSVHILANSKFFQLLLTPFEANYTLLSMKNYKRRAPILVLSTLLMSISLNILLCNSSLLLLLK